MTEDLKEVVWLGDSRDVVREFPKEVRVIVGRALRFAQRGDKHPAAKPLKGLGAGVLEIVKNYDTNTYRAVYAVKLGDKVYVLHVFQKKSKKGKKTPKQEVSLIKQRLKQAREMEKDNE